MLCNTKCLFSTEHLKKVSPRTNKIMEHQKIPDDLKLGVISPIVKTQKDKRDPNSYRWITINSVIWKPIDKELDVLTTKDTASSSSNHQ